MASQIEATAAESSPVEDNSILEPECTRHPSRRCCLFWNLGCQTDWERIPKSEGGEEKSSIKRSWLRKRIDALKDQMRRWPQLMAFFRRFDKTPFYGSKTRQFRYDPLSYARNFDEGPMASVDDDIDDVKYRSFSFRFARSD